MTRHSKAIWPREQWIQDLSELKEKKCVEDYSTFFMGSPQHTRTPGPLSRTLTLLPHISQRYFSLTSVIVNPRSLSNYTLPAMGGGGGNQSQPVYDSETQNQPQNSLFPILIYTKTPSNQYQNRLKMERLDDSKLLMIVAERNPTCLGHHDHILHPCTPLTKKQDTGLNSECHSLL